MLYMLKLTPNSSSEAHKVSCWAAGMQDVDQRLTRDVDRLCTDLAELIPTMVKPVVDITWFSWQLWRLTGRRGMSFLYLYSFLGFFCLKLVTPDFGLLAAAEYRLEGAFRLGLPQIPLCNLGLCLCEQTQLELLHVERQLVCIL